jgi:hypothetical protein
MSEEIDQTTESARPQEYIGDGVYASFDGNQIGLTVNDHRNPVAVYLESAVMCSLIDYARQVGMLK